MPKKPTDKAKMTPAEIAANARAHKKPVKKRDGLNHREQAFVRHYLGAANQNGTEAAILAGYSPNGGREGARRIAYDLRRRPMILDAIEAGIEARNARLDVTADDVLREIVILKADAEGLPKNSPALRTRLDILKTLGDHVRVNAFRKQIGIASPTGGPIELLDHAALAKLTDEELQTLERAREIMDRIAGQSSNGAQASDGVDDPRGNGAEAEG